MLQSIETLEDGSIIGFWLIEETEDELITLLGNRSDLLDAMASFSSEKRRLEFVATRVLLKRRQSPIHLMGIRSLRIILTI